MSWRSLPILAVVATLCRLAMPCPAHAQSGWKFTTMTYEVPSAVVERAIASQPTAIFDRTSEEFEQLGIEATVVVTWVLGTRFRSEFAGGYAFGDYATGHMAFVSTEQNFGIRITPESAKQWQAMADEMAAAARGQDPLGSIRERMDQDADGEPVLQALNRTGPGGCEWYELTIGRNTTHFCSDRDHPAAEMFRSAINKTREMLPITARGEQGRATDLMSQQGLTTIVKELTSSGFMPPSYSLQLMSAEHATLDTTLLQERPDESITWLTVEDILKNKE